MSLALCCCFVDDDTVQWIVSKIRSFAVVAPSYAEEEEEETTTEKELMDFSFFN